MKTGMSGDMDVRRERHGGCAQDRKDLLSKEYGYERGLGRGSGLLICGVKPPSIVGLAAAAIIMFIILRYKLDGIVTFGDLLGTADSKY